MPFLESPRFLSGLFRLARANPFSPEWVEQEKKALGSKFQPSGTVHLWSEERIREHPNLGKLTERTEELAGKMLAKLKAGERPGTSERPLYESLILYLLYRRYRLQFDRLIAARKRSAGERPHRPTTVEGLWEDFLGDFNEFFRGADSQPLTELPAEHVFAWFFQIRRAFRQIFDCIVGSSESVIRLRQQVWDSIFTHDIRHYAERLYTRMRDFNTLITGESGTGKELAAQAIGMSQYIRFDPSRRRFEADFHDSFCGVNLAGMPASLIESELFGYAKGAFTGAEEDHRGLLETINDSGALFLDEIGEVDPSIQVKLLRAIETREFCPVGGRQEKKKSWKGKIIAASNRDFSEDVRQRRFRQDLYYRLCGDEIETPPLRRQLKESPEDLNTLILFATRRILGHDGEAAAELVRDWIGENLGNYPWPGNFRELEQCVRNVILHGRYRPKGSGGDQRVEDNVRALAEHGLSAEEVLAIYCRMVYEDVGREYQAAAKRTGLNWRTVKRHVLAAGQPEQPPPRASGSRQPKKPR